MCFVKSSRKMVRPKKNGAQYGAPFNEADWDDGNDDDIQNRNKSLPYDGPSLAASALLENQSFSVIRSIVNPRITPGESMIEIGPSLYSGLSVSEENKIWGHGRMKY